MRWTRVAVAFACLAPTLAAQQAAQPTARADAPRAGGLTAEVHYGTAGDAWFATNKPAYVALFDVSRSSVRQLYPTFTAQAAELSGTSVHVDLRTPAGSSGKSSLVSLSAPPPSLNAAGWPHTLLVVASTMPLRIGNSWTTTFALNNDIVRDHNWNDLDTDEGVKAIVDLVRPLDWGADVAIDQVQSATPVTYVSSLTHDPNGTIMAYSCVDATHTFSSPVPMLGANCVPAAGYAPVGGPTGVSATLRGGVVDTVQAAKNLRSAGTGPGTSRISEQKHAAVQSISDPADIRKFMEHWRTDHAPADAGSTGGPHGGQARDQNGGPAHDANRSADHTAHRDADRPATTVTPGVSRQAAPPTHTADKPSAPPSGAPASGKPPTEQN